MARPSPGRYQQRLAVAMIVYVGTMLLVWPQVGHVSGLLLKILLATAPALPMLYVIGLMAGRIQRSDELEQRTHLVALGVATAVVGALSLVGGFLASAQVLPLDGTILIWVFPVLMISYGSTRWWVARRYGMSLSCDDDSGMPMYLRWLLAAALLAGLALFAHLRQADHGAGLLSGMAAVFAVAGAVFGIRRWRLRHMRRGALPQELP